MKRNEILAVLIFIAATILTVIGVLSIEKFRISKFYNVELIARAPNHGNWYPQKIEVPYGKEVKIHIRNIETVSHGFALPKFNVSVPEIKAGEAADIKFAANERGTFPFMCTVWCSDHHLDMTGEIVVK